MTKRTATTVKFTGAMTVDGIRSARRQLLAALAEGDHVNVDCSGVEEADATFIRVLLAAHVGAASAGKTVRLASPAEGALRATVERTGFAGDSASAERRFWDAE